MTIAPDFREFAACLNAHEVHYLIVGGYAVAFHGHPRYTNDLDVEGVRLSFIGLEDLCANKRASGRHQDMADVENLE